MRFKQNWSILLQIWLGLCVICAILIPFVVYFLCRNEWTLALFFLFGALFIAACFGYTVRAIPGGRTNEIKMDTRGITLYQDGGTDQFFPWDEIASVRKSKRYGTNTLIITNDCGEEIWFFTSRRIEAFMMNHVAKTPVAYYFYDTDETGTAEYDLRGDAYQELLELCGKYCTTVSFLDRTRSKRWDAIEACCIPIPDYVSAVYRRHYALDDEAQSVQCFRVTDEVLRCLADHADGVFDRNCGVEDPSFFREDGTTFYTCVSHEGECILTPRDSEDVEALISNRPWTTKRRSVY